MSKRERLHKACQELGSYYGVAGQDNRAGYLQHLRDNRPIDESAASEEAQQRYRDAEFQYVYDEDLLSKFKALIHYGGGNAVGTRELTDQIKQALSSRKDRDRNLTEISTGGFDNEVRKHIQIVYDESSVIIDATKDNQGTVLGVNPFSYGADRAPKAAAIKPYSIKKMLGVSPDSIINKNPAAQADKMINPQLSSISIKDIHSTPASKDARAVQLFLGSIPTLEYSRAIPYLSVNVIQDGPPINSAGQLRSFTIAASLLGNTQVAAGSSAYAIGTARDELLYETLNTSQNNSAQPSSGQTSNNESETQAGAIAEIDASLLNWDPTTEKYTTSGMEMFLSPQTMAPLNDLSRGHLNPYSPVGQRQDNSDAKISEADMRRTPVLDRFRPLAIIENFEAEQKPTQGFLSWFTATMVIKCLDRSRLHELAPLVKPGNISGGQTRVLIDWGWNHPDAQNTGQILSNPFGTFIGMMRSRQMFQVTNSEYDFDDDGVVTITLSLATLGGTDTSRLVISEDENVSSARREVENLVNSLNMLVRESQVAPQQSANVQGKTFLNSMSTVEGALSLDNSTKTKLRRFMQSRTRQGGAFRGVKDQLKELYGPNVDGTKGKVKEYKDSISQAIKRKLDGMKSGEDPYIWHAPLKSRQMKRYIDPPPNWEQKNPSRRKYISLGKILMHFVGESLATSGLYDEVQFVFYPINMKASWMAGVNIAAYPINKDDFNKKFTKLTETGINMPLSKFMSFLENSFVGSQSDFPYGFRSTLYSVGKSGATLKRKYQQDSTVLNNAMDEILRAAYSNATEPTPASQTGDVEFKQPRLAFQFETTNLKTYPSENPGADQIAAATGIPQQGKICLRIHIYDQSAESNPGCGALTRASTEQTVGAIVKMMPAIATAVQAGGTRESANRPGSQTRSTRAHAASTYLRLMLNAEQLGLVVPIGEVETTSTGLKIPKSYRWRLGGHFGNIKEFVSYQMPYIKFGQQNSSIISAKVATETNDLLSTISYQNARTKTAVGPSGQIVAGLPMQLQPIKCSLECLGTPLFKIAQQFFIDFSTGTSIDNVYQVTSLKHTLSAGEYKTSVELRNMESFGVYSALSSKMSEAASAIETFFKSDTLRNERAGQDVRSRNNPPPGSQNS